MEANNQKINQRTLINMLINKYKKEGFIVETELKSSGNFQYFEMRKYKKLDSKSQKILNEKLYFEANGEDFLSETMQIKHHINRKNNQ